MGGIPVGWWATAPVQSFKSCPRMGGIFGGVSVKRIFSLFQVVPPHGGHHLDTSIGRCSIDVSSRAPAWGASTPPSFFLGSSLFQVVPPHGGHPYEDVLLPLASWFQVVPPHGGHRYVVNFCPSSLLFQVVPPHGGHHYYSRGSYVCYLVSSRAPAWGASKYLQPERPASRGFQVVPPHGGHQVQPGWRGTD